MNKTKLTPTQEYLQIYFRYDPETGIFTDLAGNQGNISAEGYLRFSIYGQYYKVHRLIWKLIKNEEPDKINHKDGNRLNNIWTNLENGDDKNNGRNQGLFKTNKSGYPGVSFHKKSNKWVAQMRVNNRVVYLGCFNCPTNAYMARLLWFKNNPGHGYSQRHIRGY